jgi:hypothetical protein
MKKYFHLAGIAFYACVAASAHAAVYQVAGSGNLLNTAQKVKDGDTVIFAPGTYYECASWRASNLTLRAAKPGTAVFDGVSCEGKAIFVISGNNAVVDGLVFNNAAVPDKNGAGIRAEGTGLTIRNSRFNKNENGILSSANATGTIIIENSIFDGNGKCEAGCAHGIYVNTADKLIIQRSTFINTHIGHHIKSRAKTTIIENSVIDDGPNGNSSYLIEFPNGGNVLLRNSRLIKGPGTDNKSTFISYAGEGLTNPVTSFVIEATSFTNKLSNKPVLVRGIAGPPPVFRSITVVGPISSQFSR